MAIGRVDYDSAAKILKTSEHTRYKHTHTYTHIYIYTSMHYDEYNI